MKEHEITSQPAWLHIKYGGEDRDDGCVNELSLYRQNDAPELQLLVSNVDFNNVSHDNTFALTKKDARILAHYLQEWSAH